MENFTASERVTLVEQELLTFSEYLSSHSVLVLFILLDLSFLCSAL
jgi:hypothetical protein